MNAATFCAEVRDLHDLFQTVFSNGDPDGVGVANFAARLDDSFWIVDPRGMRRDRASIVDAVRGHAGGGPITIQVDNCGVVIDEHDLVIGTYVERHISGTKVSERLSTAGLRRDAAAPTGWRWLFVHETWREDSDV